MKRVFRFIITPVELTKALRSTLHAKKMSEYYDIGIMKPVSQDVFNANGIKVFERNAAEQILDSKVDNIQ